jgi:hypothetical protein
MADARALRERIVAVILAAGAGACGKQDMPISEVAQPAPTPATVDSALVSGPDARRRVVERCLYLDDAKRLAIPNAPNDTSSQCPSALDTSKHEDEAWPRGVMHAGVVSANLDPRQTSMRRNSGKTEDCCYGPPYAPFVVRGRALVTADGELAIVAVTSGRANAASGARAIAIGEAWLHDARLEHASIASFARATLELMAHAAPAALIEATQRASLDEIRHASLCFALASRHLGRELAAGSVEACGPRGGSLADLAVRVFIEGCAGETIAALVAERSLASCSDDEARAALEVIAADEARHAELAWSTLAWAVTTGGPEVREALANAESTSRPDRGPDRGPAPDPDPLLGAHGRLSSLEETHVARAAWQDVIGPSLDLLLSS